MGFDPMCNSKFRKAMKNGGVGYTDGGSFTYDGNSAGKIVIPVSDTAQYVKVSDKVVSPESIKKMIVTIPGYTTGEMQITGFNNFDLTAGVPVTAIAGTFNGSTFGGATWIIPTTVSMDGFTVEKGLYVLHNVGASAMYISLVEWETIHPIDPKYLPGDTIDLDAYGIDLATLVYSGGGATTVGDATTSAKLRAEIAEKKPKYVTTNFGVEYRMAVTSIADDFLAFILVGNDGDTIMMIKVAITASSNGIRVIVEVG